MTIESIDARDRVSLLDKQAVSAFKGSLRGELIQPGDDRL